jgi:hypothetical protein
LLRAAARGDASFGDYFLEAFFWIGGHEKYFYGRKSPLYKGNEAGAIYSRFAFSFSTTLQSSEAACSRVSFTIS